MPNTSEQQDDNAGPALRAIRASAEAVRAEALAAFTATPAQPAPGEADPLYQLDDNAVIAAFYEASGSGSRDCWKVHAAGAAFVVQSQRDGTISVLGRREIEARIRLLRALRRQREVAAREPVEAAYWQARGVVTDAGNGGFMLPGFML